MKKMEGVKDRGVGKGQEHRWVLFSVTEIQQHIRMGMLCGILPTLYLEMKCCLHVDDPVNSNNFVFCCLESNPT